MRSVAEAREKPANRILAVDILASIVCVGANLVDDRNVVAFQRCPASIQPRLIHLQLRRVLQHDPRRLLVDAASGIDEHLQGHLDLSARHSS